jgi:hypothetical protein
MHDDSKEPVQHAIARFEKMTSPELCVYLSAGSVKWWTEESAKKKREEEADVASFMRIDSDMLRGLRIALRREVSEENGNEILIDVWSRMRRAVCEDWDLCGKLGIADGGLMMKLIEHLHNGTAPSEHDLIVVVVVLGFRMGPAWMCDCGSKKTPKKVTGS